MSANFFIENACDAALCRIADGESDALAVIYEKLGRKIFMLSFSILGNKQDAEDIMQQTFMKLLSSASGYKKGTNARAYILKITQNLSLNLLDKRNRERERILPEDENIPHCDFPRFEELEALSLIGEDDRQIVVLKIECGMTHRQIASLLGISTAACEKRYRRSIEKLKGYYSK